MKQPKKNQSWAQFLIFNPGNISAVNSSKANFLFKIVVFAAPLKPSNKAVIGYRQSGNRLYASQKTDNFCFYIKTHLNETVICWDSQRLNPSPMTIINHFNSAKSLSRLWIQNNRKDNLPNWLWQSHSDNAFCAIYTADFNSRFNKNRRSGGVNRAEHLKY